MFQTIALKPAIVLPAAVTNTVDAVKEFIRDDKGQDFAEYALILGVIGLVAVAVLYNYRVELIAAWNSGITALQMAH